ncbi:hypothetical protein T07_13190 [Trichinella nelsoni]|uniref:Uncharacterized protein n=1 Tax=Trichinella nelsoni TaxID=6336 RepID=A0A0V0RCH9_9BILA|nr:hypothetical protein T07_13190 [Trichinella nelsoni]
MQCEIAKHGLLEIIIDLEFDTFEQLFIIRKD